MSPINAGSAVDKRRAAQRTALIVGAVALAVYVGFLILAAVGGK